MAREVETAVTVPQYRKSWAVIIGINYADLSGATRIEIPELRTAENDAQAVRDELVNRYGYKPEHVKLLLGKEATRENIRKLFGDDFLGSSREISAADSVLFYFAGHGNRRETISAKEQHVGLLYPHDVQLTAKSGVDTISCLRIDELLGYLRDYCAARHKLVILDSCHSGEVFNFHAHRSAGVNRGFRADLFGRPAFQAIAAARGSQTAADADETGQHSPVTRALLDALAKGPAGDGQNFFTASELFSYIPQRVASMPGISQDPRGGWIAGEGDFYFFANSLDVSEIPQPQLLAWQQQSRSVLGTATGTTTGVSLRWYWLGGGASIVVVALMITLLRRKRQQTTTLPVAATAVPSSAESPPQANKPIGPTLALRVVGTSILYHADPAACLIRVGRQKRRPGESPQMGNDLVIRTPQEDDSLKISRQHFRIENGEDGLFIIDSSSKGTDVNQSHLTKGVPSRLRPGDIINVAGVLQLEVFLLTDRPAGKVVTSAEVNSPTPSAGQMILEASVGDMITTE